MSLLEKSLEEDNQKYPVYNQKDLEIANTVITDIISGTKSKEDYKSVLTAIKNDKDLKNYLINSVVEKVFGKGRLGGYVKFAAKIYLSAKFGI